jgi:hypothetical protein
MTCDVADCRDAHRAPRSAIGWQSRRLIPHFKKYRSPGGTFWFVAARHETVAFCWLFLAPQQKATGTV